jgi:hypothetical protein
MTANLRMDCVCDLEALLGTCQALWGFEASANTAMQLCHRPAPFGGFFQLREDTLGATEGTTRFRGCLWSSQCRNPYASQRYDSNLSHRRLVSL